MSNSVTPWSVAYQAPLSSTILWILLKFMSTELVMLFNHLFLCHPLLLLPSVFLSIRIFSNEPVLCIRWPKYLSFSNCLSNEYSRLVSSRIDWFGLLQSKSLSRVFSSTTILKHQCFGARLSYATTLISI